VGEQQECMELFLGLHEESAESLWVRITGKTTMVDNVMSVCYRSHDEEEAGETRQLEEASCSQSLVLTRELNHLHIC